MKQGSGSQRVAAFCNRTTKGVSYGVTGPGCYRGKKEKIIVFETLDVKDKTLPIFIYFVFVSAVSHLHMQLRGGERGKVGCVGARDTDTTSCNGEVKLIL